MTDDNHFASAWVNAGTMLGEFIKKLLKIFSNIKNFSNIYIFSYHSNNFCQKNKKSGVQILPNSAFENCISDISSKLPHMHEKINQNKHSNTYPVKSKPL